MLCAMATCQSTEHFLYEKATVSNRGFLVIVSGRVIVDSHAVVPQRGDILRGVPVDIDPFQV